MTDWMDPDPDTLFNDPDFLGETQYDEDGNEREYDEDDLNLEAIDDNENLDDVGEDEV